MSVISDLRAAYPNLQNVSDDDIINYTAAQNGIKAGSDQFNSLRDAMGGYSRTWGDVAGDVAVGIGKGVAGLGQAAGMLGGAILPGVSAFDNPVVNASKAASAKLDTFRSQGSLNQQAAADQDMRLAEQRSAARGDDAIQSATSEFTTFLKGLADHPAIATDLLAQQVPQLGLGKLLGLVGNAVGTAARLGEAGAARLGTAAVVGGMAGQQGAQAGQMAYDELVKRGVSPDDAAAQAGIAVAKATPASAGLMLLPGARNLPKALSGEAITTSSGRIGTILRSAGAEAAAQGADQGFTQYVANQPVNAVDPSFSLYSGVGSGAAMGAAMGLGTGAFGGAMVPLRPRTATGDIDLTRPPQAPTSESSAGQDRAAPGISVSFPSGFESRSPQEIAAQNSASDSLDIPPVMRGAGGTPTGQGLTLPANVDRPAALRKAQVQGPTLPAAGEPDAPTGAPQLPPPQVPLALPYNPTMFADPTGTVQVGAMPDEQGMLQRKYPVLPADPRNGGGPPDDTSGGGGMPLVDAAGPVVDPVQRTPANFVDLAQGDTLPPNPFEPPPAARAVTPGRPTTGELLRAIQQEKRTYVKKDGQLANNAGGLAMRSILEADDPMAVIRSMYADGAGPRDELLDNLHKRFTGQTVDEFNAAQEAGGTNSAGFVPEPASDVKGQLDALREGRKDTVVLGKGEARGHDVTGLSRITVTDPKTKESAIVFTLPKNKKLAARAQVRAAKVGLKQAMGEMQGVANPEATTRPTGAPVAAVQQRDSATGAVLSSEVVTPQDLARVQRVPGTTAEVVPVQEAMTRRLAGGDAPAVAPAAEINTVNSEPQPKPGKPPRLGRKPVEEVVDLANTAKDEPTFNAAEDELYRRWVDMGDEQAENYFLADVRTARKNQSKAAAFADSTYGKELQARYEQSRDAKGVRHGQELGTKFGASVRSETLDPYDGTEQRVGTTARTRSIGRRALEALARLVHGGSEGGRPRAEPANRSERAKAGTKGPLIPRRLQGEVEVLGQRLIDDFVAGRPSQLVGQVVRSAADVAALAQVYRDPRFETTRVLFLDEGGKVLGESALTSRLPGMVALGSGSKFADLIGQGLSRLHASKYVLIHNHPDGNPRPSPDDVRMTQYTGAHVPGLFNHVVVDHNSYAVIEPSGQHRVVPAPDLAGRDFTATPAVPHPLLGRALRSTDDVFGMAKELESPTDKVQLIALDSARHVQQITQMPLAALNDDGPAAAIKATALIRRLIRTAGASNSRVLVIPDGTKVPPLASKLLSSGVVSFIVDHEGHGAAHRGEDPFLQRAGAKSNARPLDAQVLRQEAQPVQGEMNGFSTAQAVEAVNTHPAMKGLGAAASRVRDEVRDTVRGAGNEIHPALLSALTFNQIVEHYGKVLPAMGEVKDAIFERAARASQLASRADRVARQWARALRDSKDERAFNDVLLGASDAEILLDNTDPQYLAGLDARQRSEHARLRAILASLPPQLQAVRHDALAILHEQWQYTRSAVEHMIRHTLPDPAARAARLRQLNETMGRVKGDYFPLARFGNRVVVGKGAAKDGRDVVTFHETLASAEREVRRLKAQGVKNIAVNLLTERDPRQRATTGFMGDLHTMIEGSDAPAEVKEMMHQDLQQLYLKSLPEMSGAKHMIRRDNVEGYSQDALRGFADSVTRGAHYAANLDFAPRVQAGMEAAEVQSRSSDKRSAALIIARKGDGAPVIQVTAPGTERFKAVSRLMDDGYDVQFFNGTVPETVREHLAGLTPELTDAQVEGVVKQVETQIGRNSEGVEDMRAAKALYNHLVKLQRTEPHGTGLATKAVDFLGQVGYTWYLGFTPAFWTMNLLQNPMIGIPHLAGRYGLAKSVAAMGEAARWFSTVRIGKLLARDSEPFSVAWLRKQNLKGVSKDVLDMLQYLEDNQALDFTQARDLGRIASNSNSTWTKAMRLAAAGAHHTEVFNRVTYAITEYNLALRSSPTMTHAKAMQRALDGVRTVHFDYTTENKPLAMRGNVMRLPLMFQQYRQHMLHWWGNTVLEAIKGETPEVRHAARKAAFLMGATHAIFAGALGLPFVGTIGMLANMFGPDEDENGVKFDFNRWVTEAAREATGSDAAAEVLTKGIFSAMNMDLGQRIGQANLLPFLNQQAWQYGNSNEDKVRNVLVDLLGPLGSIAVKAAGSTTAFSQGDTLGGLAAVTPKALSDVLKAINLQRHGVTDKQGEPIALAEAFDGSDVFMQAAGVNPASVARIKQDRNTIRDIEQSVRDKTSRLRNRFVESWSRNDSEGMQDALAAIGDYNKTVAGGKLRAVPGALIDGRSLVSAIRSRQQQALVRVLTHGTADTKRQMMLALTMSGLLNPATLQSAGDALPAVPGVNQ